MTGTFSYDILDGFGLLLGKEAFILFSQFWEHQGTNDGEDSREDRIARIQQPSRVGRVLQVNATFQDRVLADAEVSSNWGHVVGVGGSCGSAVRDDQILDF